MTIRSVFYTPLCPVLSYAYRVRFQQYNVLVHSVDTSLPMVNHLIALLILCNDCEGYAEHMYLFRPVEELKCLADTDILGVGDSIVNTH